MAASVGTAHALGAGTIDCGNYEHATECEVSGLETMTSGPVITYGGRTKLDESGWVGVSSALTRLGYTVKPLKFPPPHFGSDVCLVDTFNKAAFCDLWGSYTPKPQNR